ncbi:MAG: hypothetical protein GY953_39440 [bacterium]|nr:hypothetical protein [bacterium]
MSGLGSLAKVGFDTADGDRRIFRRVDFGVVTDSSRYRANGMGHCFGVADVEDKREVRWIGMFARCGRIRFSDPVDENVTMDQFSLETKRGLELDDVTISAGIDCGDRYHWKDKVIRADLSQDVHDAFPQRK